MIHSRFSRSSHSLDLLPKLGHAQSKHCKNRLPKIEQFFSAIQRFSGVIRMVEFHFSAIRLLFNRRLHSILATNALRSSQERKMTVRRFHAKKRLKNRIYSSVREVFRALPMHTLTLISHKQQNDNLLHLHVKNLHI